MRKKKKINHLQRSSNFEFAAASDVRKREIPKKGNDADD
jgi:hypothetical protein